MALWKFTNTNKYGNLRSRVVYNPDDKPFTIGRGFGPFVAARVFKYDHEHILPPSLFTSPVDGQRYIVPGWQKVHPDTQLSDINWIKPEVKQAEPQKNEWLFESSSDPGHFYKVRQVGVKYTCNCPGVWRSKDRRCKHIKEVEKLIK